MDKDELKSDIIADRFAGRAIVTIRAMLFHAFEEKLLRVIGIS